MSGLKAIRRRITSVSNTKQITRAMKLVSAAKLRKAQDAALNGRDFAARLKHILANIVATLPEDFEHPLIRPRDEIKSRRVIAISGERGLCGGFNSNILKAVEIERRAANTEILCVGRRAVSAGRSSGWNTVGAFENLPEDAAAWPVEDLLASTLRDYQDGKCDEVVLVYTTFVSAVTQEVTREVLLPLKTEADTQAECLKFEPSAEIILESLLPVLINTKVKQAALESKASEHAARMAAMDAATSNATDLIGKLKLHYNRARQRAITTELIDIVGGAEAVS